jgi:uncharacterized protein involved in exopolysaccharide biosynthesis
MSEEQKIMHDPEDEVSFVDLLAVCIRYRRLIVGLPVIVTLAAILALYVLPILGVNRTKQSYTEQIVVGIGQQPKNLQEYLDFDVIKSLNAALSSTQTVQDLYSKYFPSEVSGMDADALSSFVQSGIIGKRLTHAYDANESLFTLRFQANDKKKTEEFTLELWARASSSVQDILSEKYATAISLMKQQLNSSLDGKQDSAALLQKSAIAQTYQVLSLFQNSKQFPFRGDKNAMLIVNPQQSRKRAILLIFFSSLFAAILGAFILNAARGIRQDPQSMAKLKEAWGAKK